MCRGGTSRAEISLVGTERRRIGYPTGPVPVAVRHAGIIVHFLERLELEREAPPLGQDPRPPLPDSAEAVVAGS